MRRRSIAYPATVFALSIACLMAGLSCEDSSTGAPSEDNVIDFGTYDVSAYLPLALGDEWIYEFQADGESAIVDRRIVLDSVRAANGLWMFGYSEPVLTFHPDTLQAIEGFIGIYGGTIYFADSRVGSPGPLIPYLSTPIVAGRAWVSLVSSEPDSFCIVSVGSGFFRNQAIDTVVVVQRTRTGIVYSLSFARGIGLLRQTMCAGTDTLSTRQLRSYVLTN
jgi:hypothetical protein